MFSYKTRRGERSFFIFGQRFIGFSHKQNSAVFTDERLWAFMKHVACNSGETQTLKVLSLFLRDIYTLGQNSRKRVARAGKL